METNMKKQGTTHIKKIAERAGVSPGTVSLVLNGRGDELRISKSTQQHVKEVAKEMNYQPNIYARRLRSARGKDSSKVIAVFWSTEFMDDMMGRFFMGMQKVVAAGGYNLEFFIQLFDYDKLSDWKNIMNSSRFSGIIVSGVSDFDTEFLNKNSFDVPIVLINRNEERYHFVYVNDYEIGKSVAKLFHNRNHKNVGLISMKRKGRSAMMRQTGFLENCERLKMDIRSEWIEEMGGRDYASGYHATQRMLQSEEKPDAIFVMSYGQVLGTVEAIKDAGLKIPEDIEVLTYGDSLTFKHYSPSISSIYIPVETLAENALSLLILVIDNGIEIPMSRMLYADYVFRKSCGGFIDDTVKTN
jgi:LacI family transcriptional regulator